MIASFFQRLEADGVDYLLISGQATILYGAATFSEDVDIWLRPAALEAKASLPRRADRRYWKAIIEELRELRRGGHLLEEGAEV